MKVYSPHEKQQKGKHTIRLTPGTKNPDSAFMRENEKGEKVPQLFTVTFNDGMAVVDDALGKWMVDNKVALKSKKLIKLLTD
ncbi:MAG TPA: hypothetical protein VGH91_04495 [Gammaproteobacteria bacterium]